MRRVTTPELDATGLGYRLRYLSGGMSAASRTINGRVLPERAGYYVGWRIVEPFVAAQGVARAARARATDVTDAELQLVGAQTA